MEMKDKVFWSMIFFLLVLSIMSENQIIMTISTLGIVVLILSMKLSDYILRRKLIKEIERENIEYVKTKENNKLVILTMLISIFGIFTSIKSKYEVFKNDYDATSNILTFIDSFDSYEKLILLIAIVVTVFLIIHIAEVILNPCIVSKDKIIFYDGVVVDINKIESIEYVNSFNRKNKKIIKVSKGLLHRKIITNLENFDKVKMLLEAKNQ